MPKKKEAQFLKRPYRVMIRYNKKELRQFLGNVKMAGLSQAEYGRRKTLDIPIAQVEPAKQTVESKA